MINLAVNVDLLSGLLAGASCNFTGPVGLCLFSADDNSTFLIQWEKYRDQDINRLLIVFVLLSLRWIVAHSYQTRRMKYPTSCIQGHLSKRYDLMDCVVCNTGLTNHVDFLSGKEGKMNEECHSNSHPPTSFGHHHLLRNKMGSLLPNASVFTG